MPPNDESTLLNQEKLAALLANEVSTATLEKWRCTGQGPRFIRVGRKVLYRRTDIEAWLTSRTVTHTQAEFAAPAPPPKRRRKPYVA